MKITHNKIGQNINTSDLGKSDKAKKTDQGVASLDPSHIGEVRDKSARVEVSERAQDMKRIKDLAMATPDVDEAKVAKFQKLIDSGKYKVDAEAVADRMVDEHLAFSE